MYSRVFSEKHYPRLSAKLIGFIILIKIRNNLNLFFWVLLNTKHYMKILISNVASELPPIFFFPPIFFLLFFFFFFLFNFLNIVVHYEKNSYFLECNFITYLAFTIILLNISFQAICPFIDSKQFVLPW